MPDVFPLYLPFLLCFPRNDGMLAVIVLTVCFCFCMVHCDVVVQDADGRQAADRTGNIARMPSHPSRKYAQSDLRRREQK